MNKARRIYVDTNVLINYCTGVPADTSALNYIFSKRRKEVLFTSTLAIVQTITNLQTKKKSRRAFSKEQTVLSINKLLSKFTVLDLTLSDVTNGFNSDAEDVEDGTHYILSQKKKCDAILTNNTKDFAHFSSVYKISPKSSLGIIKAVIN